MNYLGGFLISIVEGVLFSFCFIYASGLRKKRLPYLMLLFIIIEITTVWLLYKDNEAVWPFFVHPYLSFMIINAADYIFINRDRFEKFFLWPFYVIPAMSGFVLVWGWIIKIHALRELFGALFKQ